MGRRLREGLLLLIVGLALLALLALATYSPGDPGWSFTGHATQVENQAGWFGAWFADIFFYLFGLGAFLVPLMAAWMAWDYLRPAVEDQVHQLSADLLRWGGMILTLMGGSAYAAVQLGSLALYLPTGAGGVVGQLLVGPAVLTFGTLGGTLVLLLHFLLGVTLLTGLSWFVLMEMIGGAILWFGRYLLSAMETLGGLLWIRRTPLAATVDPMTEAHPDMDEVLAEVAHSPVLQRVEPSLKVAPKNTPEPELPLVEPEPEDVNEDSPSLLQMLQNKAPVQPQAKAGKALKKPSVPLMPTGERLPSLHLLEEAPPRVGGYSQAMLDEMSREVEARLKDYNVQAEVVEVHPGPVVTLFELQLAPGTKASKVTGLSNDLARSLSTSRVRVVEVIPGKTTIGLEKKLQAV
jgi:S-DNA-T family DNA segregation ATPase FtsK/SpoIIIE